ncbi:TolC family protein [Pelagerythrobacter marensis]|uniref:Outer membrane protein n=2 Tax=Pelagerythrobacter marensis TaxID=543877 RepID=A0A0G3X963_9SPHN|nr:TolC family protein [Pelagerythrobacter marensis]AKM07737.1 Outer membrane protein [Pelagerythrobacter marensis]
MQKYRWLGAIALACAPFFPSGLAALPPEVDAPLTIRTAAREAVAWHPSVEEAEADLASRTEEIDVAEAGYLPRVEAGVGSGYDNIGQSRWRPRANVSVSQMLYDFGKVRSTVASAEAGTRVGEARLLIAVDTLIRDTSFAVIELQRVRALQQIANDQLESVSSIADLVRHRYQRGAATKADLLQADARVYSARATIEQIEAEHQRWQASLAHYLGRDRAPPVSTDFPEDLLRSCQTQPDWAGVPAIQEVRARRDLALAEFERSQAESMPTVSLSVGGATDIHDPFGDREEYNFGINVSTSLYNGGANRARIRGASHALGAADAAEARIHNEVSRILAEAQRQVASFDRVIDTLAFREASMRETGKLYRLQYLQMGTKTLVDLLNAEQELHQVRFDRANTQHDLRRLQIDCLVTSGAARAAFGLAGTVVGGATL